jgi:Cysteine-rich CPXCG
VNWPPLTARRSNKEIVVFIHLSAGAEQEYVEDSPVCCLMDVVHVEVDEYEEVRVRPPRE